MKKLFFLLSIIASIFFVNSCTEEDDNDKCASVNCLNGGTCNNGTCSCPSGFTGDSCQTVVSNPCAGVTCLNGGTCNNGICNCPPNYTGDSCQTYTGTTWSTAPFVGYYTGSTTCGGSANLDVTDSSSVPNRLYFDGGTNEPEADYYGDLTGATAFTIPSQQLNNTLANPAPYISGSGSLSGNTITMSYTVSGITCNFTVTK